MRLREVGKVLNRRLHVRLLVRVDTAEMRIERVQYQQRHVATCCSLGERVRVDVDHERAVDVHEMEAVEIRAGSDQAGHEHARAVVLVADVDDVRWPTLPLAWQMTARDLCREVTSQRGLSKTF